MTCQTCNAPLIDYGTWPQLDSGSQLRQCWKCPTCKRFFKFPIKDPAQ